MSSLYLDKLSAVSSSDSETVEVDFGGIRWPLVGRHEFR